MRAVGRRLFQGAHDDRRNVLVADLARSPGPKLVVLFSTDEAAREWFEAKM